MEWQRVVLWSARVGDKLKLIKINMRGSAVVGAVAAAVERVPALGATLASVTPPHPRVLLLVLRQF